MTRSRSATLNDEWLLVAARVESAEGWRETQRVMVKESWPLLQRILNAEVLECLERIHYRHFMANPRFWYERELQEADMMIVVAASNLRAEGRTEQPSLSGRSKAAHQDSSATRSRRGEVEGC